jgi:hypothetical protein
MPSGPRGATLGPDGATIYQAITEFTGTELKRAYTEKMEIEGQALRCAFDLESAITFGPINARGIELDPRDSNLWVSDYTGSIYKLVSCDAHGSGGPPPIGEVSAEAHQAGAWLEPNTPNPFSASTDITFNLVSAAHITLRAYDGAGLLIATLADGRYEQGRHTVVFHAEGIAAGVYRCTLSTDSGQSATRLLVHVK